jgi:ADP-ribosylglycohydrolase
MARNFIRWRDNGEFTAHGEVFDIGRATSRAIERLKAGTVPEKAGCTGAHENGNGSLMRIAPLVFHLAGRPEAERFDAVKAVSSVTHAHEWSVAACFIYLEFLLKILDGMEKTAAYLELRSDFRNGSPYIGSGVLRKFAPVLRSDITELPESRISSGGFVIDTLEAALWCFMTTDGYGEAVLKAVNLGDDTDTTAAVTGAIAGLAYGLEAVPAGWLDVLAASSDIHRIARTLAENRAG